MSGLSVWVIYDHPKDFPGYFAARMWVNNTPTETMIFGTTLEDVRGKLEDLGLVRIDRDPSDDPCIVESWL